MLYCRRRTSLSSSDLVDVVLHCTAATSSLDETVSTEYSMIPLVASGGERETQWPGPGRPGKFLLAGRAMLATKMSKLCFRIQQTDGSAHTAPDCSYSLCGSEVHILCGNEVYTLCGSEVW